MGFWSMHRNIKIRIITSFLTRTVSTMIFPFMAIYFSVKLGSAIAGALLLINVIASLVIGLYGGYVGDRLGRKKGYDYRSKYTSHFHCLYGSCEFGLR